MVAVLIWVGIRTDFDRLSDSGPKEAVPLDTGTEPTFFVDMKDFGEDTSMMLAEPEYEFAGRVGFQMKF